MAGITHRLGIISDTHGLLRPEAQQALLGCDHIVHAGDIGNADVLRDLALIAPLTPVRGNNDHGPWAERIPLTWRIAFGGLDFYVLHDLADLEIDAAAEGIAVVVSGHSHHPRIEDRDRVLFVNPGSAGPRRFRLPVTVAEIVVDQGRARARIVELPIAPKKKSR